MKGKKEIRGNHNDTTVFSKPSVSYNLLITYLCIDLCQHNLYDSQLFSLLINYINDQKRVNATSKLFWFVSTERTPRLIMPFQRWNMPLVHGSHYRTLTFTTTLSFHTPLIAIIRLLISLILLGVLASNFVGLPCFPKGMTALKGGGFISKEGGTTFFPFEIHERGSDEDPIEDVGKDGAQGGRIVYENRKKDGAWLVICMYGDSKRRDEKNDLLQPKMALKICQPPLVVAEPGCIKNH